MKKIEMSKIIVPFVIISIFVFTGIAMYIQFRTNVELSSTLITAFYAFCTGELWMLAGIKKTKIKNNVKNNIINDSNCEIDDNVNDGMIDEPINENDKDFDADAYDIGEIIDEIKKGDNFAQVESLDDIKEIDIKDFKKEV